MSCTAKIFVTIASAAIVQQVFCVWCLLNPSEDETNLCFKIPLVNLLATSAIAVGAGVISFLTADREKTVDAQLPPLTIENAQTIHELVEVGAFQLRHT